MTGGLAPRPASTLVDRALTALSVEPRTAEWLARAILGLPNAPPVVAERLLVALLGADPRVQRGPDARGWSLVAAARGVPLLEECAFAVVDVETTGMRPATSDRVTEIAIVLRHGARRELLFESLVNPGRPIPSIVSAMTGISDGMVRAAPRFEEVADRVLDALAGRVFVAHNARFDWAFVSAELRRTRDLRLEGPRLCTVRLARRLVPAAQSCALDALSYHFALENSARHRAAGDALVTAALLERLLRLAREAGARTLADLEGMQTARRRPLTPVPDP
ncbi:MAG TPA: 3'-5' exonuclease [Gemmatimonadales bacterium]|nr:3'-5' exonuclease [Gemmatimonadales bacterium]